MNIHQTDAPNLFNQPPQRAADESVREMIRGVRGAELPIAKDPFIRLNETFMVRAGAGSGKTSVLIERMLALVRSGVPLSEIVAITFTKKAAGEIQKRFFESLILQKQQIIQKYTSTQDEAWKEELSHVEIALQHAESIFIGTIHSFSAQLLRLRSLDLQIPIDFVQIDEREELELRSKFWSRYLHQLNEARDPGLETLQNAQVSIAGLVELFGLMSKNASVTFKQTEVSEPDLLPVFAKFQLYFDAIKRRIPPMDPDDFSTAFEQIEALLNLSQEYSTFQQATILKMVAGLVKGKDSPQFKIGVKSWGENKTETRIFANALRDGKEELGFSASFLEFVVDEVNPVIAQWNAWLHDVALQVVFHGIESYKKERLELGKLTFDDLLHQAHELVSTHDVARSELQNQYRYLLVDEFQDTDPVQAAMLFGLASKEVDSTDWSKSVLYPGRLFLVGDDKQSIYRFRKADFQAFNLVGRAIDAQGGCLTNLSVNFRSDRRICNWINGALSPVFATSSEPYQAPWEDLNAHHGTFGISDPIVHFQIPSSKNGSQKERAVAESVAIAKHINQHAHLGYGSFLILVKRHAYVPVYVNTLVNAGIPTSITGGKATEMTQVLDWLGNVFNTCLDSSDLVSLISVLKGPFFGVSDQELIDTKQLIHGFEQLFSYDKAENLPESVRVAISLITACRLHFQTKTPYAALESVVKKLGLEVLLKNRADSDITYGMLLRVLDLFREWDSAGLTFSECVEEFEWYRTGELALDTFSENAPFGDCVRIMTVHQAKGLQADVVFLADPGGNAPGDSTLHVYREGPQVYASAPLVKPNRFGHSVELEPFGWAQANEKEKMFEEAERYRLLYVACTRAVKQLIISTNDEVKHGPWDALIPALSQTNVPVVQIWANQDLPANNAESLEAKFESRTPADDDSQTPSLWDETGVIRQIKRLAYPSWTFTRPSQKEDEPHVEPFDSEKHSSFIEQGRGMEYGSAIHSLFEQIVASRKSNRNDAAILTWSRDLMLDRFGPKQGQNFVEAAGSAALSFVRSTWWPQIAGANRVLTEVPFTVAEEVDGNPHVVSGIVDLAFRTDGIWMIVDYKTDQSTKAALVAKHRDQIASYVRAWQQIFPEESCVGAIWSTHLGEMIPIEIPKKED